MHYFFRFANIQILIGFLFLIGILFLLKLKKHQHAIYSYSLGGQFKSKNLASRHKHRTIFFILRFFSLILLAFLIGRPQLVDSRSNVLIEGIDIMLVLDVSGSMELRDYGDKKKSRVEVAKQEAIRFIDKRVHDPIGLVIFGQHAISRCPITSDKTILKSIVNDLHIGVVNPDGTVLCRAILNAANRLKDSKSKNKILIMLTDGEPSKGDEKPEIAIEVVKKMGIKVYTIGIGSDKDQIIYHPFYGPIQKPKINSELLKKIAKQTGGKFFLAANQNDMRSVYDEIDKLEKTEYETDIFSNYQEVLMPFLWIVFIFVVLEVFLSSFIWFGL
ncbi:VWA domain-containing protein [bacterium]|nr:VWA domain-containing protein [bacterium]